MGTLWTRLCAILTLACAFLSCTSVSGQVNPALQHNPKKDDSVKSELSPLQNRLQEQLSHTNHDLVAKLESAHNINHREIPLYTNIRLDSLKNDIHKSSKKKLITKREAKKPKNTKRRVKFNKKELEKKLKDRDQEAAESKPVKIKLDSSAVIKSDEPLPETQSESDKSSSTYESYSETKSSSEYSDDDEDDDTQISGASLSGSLKAPLSEEGSVPPASGSGIDDKSSASSLETEEVSLSSVASESKSKVPDSGPDSSPPASSHSEDESSASKAISGGSSEYSEISYTMSSSAEDAFPVDKSSSSEEGEEDDSEEGKKDSSQSLSKVSKSEYERKSELKLSPFKAKDKGKKLVKRKKRKSIKLSKDKTEVKHLNEIQPADVKLMKNKENSNLKIEPREKLLHNFEKTTEKVLNMVKVKNNQLNNDKIPKQNAQVTTERVLQMQGDKLKKSHWTAGIAQKQHVSPGGISEHHKPQSSKERPNMEMLKVKEAEKKEILQQELLKDYPENGTVEIVNWEGTFAPIHGEPYVAPLHHQPDSFWDAIYTSKDPDLPTPAGAIVSDESAPSAPEIKLHHQLVDGKVIQAKNKDRGGKKDQKKPKLSVKEKKKKKKEKKEKDNPNNFARSPGKFKVSGKEGNIMVPGYTPELHNYLFLHGNTGTHVQHIPIKVHAASKSQENLKTPSEEERESGTTYRPEGAYEYPSFRHPDFNPDTAYDENGIPIHESPGWTPPPTLPGDNRFGKSRNAAAAGMSHHVNGQIPMPQVAKSNTQKHNEYQGIEVHLAHKEHEQALNGLHDLQLHPVKQKDPKKEVPFILPGQPGVSPLKDSSVHHRIQKRKAAISGSQESVMSLSSEMNSKELKAAAQRIKDKEEAEDAKVKAYKLTDSELINKEDSAPLEALNPALYMHRRMMQVKKKPLEPKSINLEQFQLDKLPLDKFPLSKSAEVIAVIVKPDGECPKCHVHTKLQQGEMKMKMPLLPSMPEESLEYDKTKNEAMNPLLYKVKKMFKVSDLKDDGFRIDQNDLFKQLVQNKKENQQNKKAIPIDNPKKGPYGHTLKGRGRENFNPIFINGRKLFHVKTNKFKSNSVEQNIVAKREVKEALNPDLYGYQNLFSSDPKQVIPRENHDGLPKPEKSKQIEASNLQDPIFGGKIPVVDADSEEKFSPFPHLKQYMGRNKEALNPFLVNYPKMFKVNYDPLQSKSVRHGPEKQGTSNQKPLVPVITKYKFNNAYLKPHSKKQPKEGRVQDSLLKTERRLKRSVDEKEDQIKEAVKPKLKEVRMAKLKKNIELAGGTPGAGRPKSLKRKSKDSEDSFASYFEGVDNDVVEEDESTPQPERTTGGNRTHSQGLNRKKRKLAVRRKRVLQTNAGILHRLIKNIRPFLDKELETHNLNLKNTAVEFTNSMEQEISNAIEQKLLSGPPDEETLNQLTEQLYEIIENRKKQNRSIGHILPVVKPAKDPLLQGTVALMPGRDFANYHLQYWPLNSSDEEPRVLKGIVSIKDVKANLTDKNIANKILHRILTVKPHHLSYLKADRVLNNIFTKNTTVADREGEEVMKRNANKESAKRIAKGETKQDLEEESVPVKRGETLPVLKEKPVLVPREETKPVLKKVYVSVPRGETKAVLKKESVPAVRGETKPVLKEEPLLVPRGETKPILKEDSFPVPRGETKPILKESKLSVSQTTQSITEEELKKLKETIIESKNISSILLNEVEARTKHQEEDIEGRKTEDHTTQVGNKKLHQRIRDFKPGRPYHPTLPPFVRRWPTFRTKSTPKSLSDVIQAVTCAGVSSFSTFLTMRPKYSGPRLKPPFFFCDFQRIATVYPSSTTEEIETSEQKLGWKEMNELLGVGVSMPFNDSKELDIKDLSISFDKLLTTEAEPEEVTLPSFDEEEKKYFIQQSTTTQKQKTTRTQHFMTVKPLLPKAALRKTTTTTPMPSTTKRSHFHQIKHHVSRGFKKLLNIFGFGKIESEDFEESEESED